MDDEETIGNKSIKVEAPPNVGGAFALND